jgi:hypothetical protein
LSNPAGQVVSVDMSKLPEILAYNPENAMEFVCFGGIAVL